MLQIFVRPETTELDPDVQFVELDEAQRESRWRLLTGPVGSTAPTCVRQAVYLYDMHVSDGESIDLPSKDGFDRWFYVFDGEVSVGEQALGKYHALVVGADHTPGTATATKDSDLVVFLVDRSAKFSREGTMSG